MKACSADVKQFCSDVPAGQARAVAQCLGKNRQSVSKNCSQTLDQAKRVAVFRRSCGEDVKKVCSDVKPGEKRLISCLQQNQESLSDSCKTLVSKAKAKDAKDKDAKDIESDSDLALSEEIAGVEISLDADVSAAPKDKDGQD